MKFSRRKFLKYAAALGGSACLGGKVQAAGEKIDAGEYSGMLYDATLCIGCRMCEMACNEENGLPEPEVGFDEESVLEKERKTDEVTYAVINRYEAPEVEEGVVHRRLQCMHCNQPGCASACLVNALRKTEKGPVYWEGKNCIGCRYCMISCPFDIPKYEYHKVNPSVRKCTFCLPRQQRGEIPACAENCPTEALLFGKRGKLLEVARGRIHEEPKKYVHQIYGEHVVGGTGWLYLSPVPFERIGFRNDLGTKSMPELSSGFLQGVSQVLVLWPVFLLGLSQVTKKKKEGE